MCSCVWLCGFAMDPVTPKGIKVWKMVYFHTALSGADLSHAIKYMNYCIVQEAVMMLTGSDVTGIV